MSKVNNESNVVKLSDVIYLENLSNENVKVEIKKCVSQKEGKVYYAFFVNGSRTEFLTIPPSIYGYVRLLNNLANNNGVSHIGN